MMRYRRDAFDDGMIAELERRPTAAAVVRLFEVAKVQVDYKI